MSARGDDVSDLFKSFGAEKQQFKELARSSDAAAAETRWPLFKMIQAEGQATVPPLSDLAKTRWQHEVQALPAALRSTPGTGENAMMAQSLRQLSSQPSAQPVLRAEQPARSFPALQTMRRTAPEPAPRAAPELTPRAEPARALFGRAVEQAQPMIKNPAVPGLFSRNTAAGAELEVNADDSLSSIFKRLDGDAPATAPRKLSFLRQTERR